MVSSFNSIDSPFHQSSSASSAAPPLVAVPSAQSQISTAVLAIDLSTCQEAEKRENNVITSVLEDLAESSKAISRCIQEAPKKTTSEFSIRQAIDKLATYQEVQSDEDFHDFAITYFMDKNHRETFLCLLEGLNRRSLVVEWLNSLFPGLDIPLEASEEELRAQLFDGIILCGIVNQRDAISLANQRGSYMPSEQRQENIRRFLSAVDGMGLPRFNGDDLGHVRLPSPEMRELDILTCDLDSGSISAVVDCLLSLRDLLNLECSDGDAQVASICRNLAREKSVDVSQSDLIQSRGYSPLREDEKKISFLESRLDHVVHYPRISGIA
ncbi:hypothetical protein KSP40_PGU010548 [Platanthera guangdongensis]|uniref:Calponin-homology (CH) domain-containing protein n=1 Tax=Platanthera guangdongensis TaxID=2320717 RepID=A0ABR2N0P4_9ASPA